ncbi:DNA replication licensing factor MCM2 [Trichonephila clavata]|uniref:DNA replication licensing factor MCM2 n=1 Tax=Trichonephila clavata TaxID=2740835 RepID=A0A8X6LRA1_TRICU|nr:DNA replication licensing factor MCM2 [Trichonephila clavata]
MISGGSLLDVLNYEKYKDLNSSQWNIYYADERCSQDHLNYKGSLPFLGFLESKVFRMKTELKLDECILDYSMVLKNVTIDVCLLGIGDDGHICSLFPEIPELKSRENVIAVYNENVVSPQRVTITLKFINNHIKDLYFIVPSKEGRIKKTFKPHSSILESCIKNNIESSSEVVSYQQHNGDVLDESDNEIEEENFNTEDNNLNSDIYQYSDMDTYHNSSVTSSNLQTEPPKNFEDDGEFDKLIKDSEISKSYFDKNFFRNRIELMFSDFFNTFESRKYVKKIRKMCSENLESLSVSYMDIESFSDDMLRLLNLYPEIVIQIMDTALDNVVKNYFPNYNYIKPKVHVRIVDLPVLENIRSLRNNHLNKLVRIRGVVTRRTGVFPLYFIIKFTCMKCQAVFGPFVANSTKPTHCFECQSKGPFVVNSAETIYKDFQKLTIQEVPGTVPAGTLPRSKEVLLYYDLIDCAKPGEEVEITGIYKNNFNVALNIKNGFPVFFTVIEAVSIDKDVGKLELTEEDIKEIKRFSKRANVKNLIINSIAPSICGHSEIKRAIALSLFSGVAKEKNNHRIRGDINVLLLGDPGTAKSQFLRYIEKTSHRAVLATGQGASGVGLTATVRKDPVVKEWTLEGGALVLADKGICLIDEFDKMNEHDRTSIHEAMEQQSISISKAGIVATLHARCSVVAAANPIRGRYNSSLTFAQNVNLSDPILSRFDILCVVKDTIDVKEDEVMADFVLSSHRGKKKENSSIVDHTFLRKYIMYARNNTKPFISNINIEKISHLYSDLRKESMSSGLPITVRHIESIIRISEAFARMELRDYVTLEDIDEAISTSLDSFMGAQKYAISKNMKKSF